ncbi:DUF6000 family protein [Streptomyces sp. NPDC004327]|uniref:DUF6000 family protein n=1 Tax=unclassified Streptomyces TaxID=2593676 RepID=UPI003687A4A7
MDDLRRLDALLGTHRADPFMEPDGLWAEWVKGVGRLGYPGHTPAEQRRWTDLRSSAELMTARWRPRARPHVKSEAARSLKRPRVRARSVSGSRCSPSRRPCTSGTDPVRR